MFVYRSHHWRLFYYSAEGIIISAYLRPMKISLSSTMMCHGWSMWWEGPHEKKTSYLARCLNYVQPTMKPYPCKCMRPIINNERRSFFSEPPALRPWFRLRYSGNPSVVHESNRTYVLSSSSHEIGPQTTDQYCHEDQYGPIECFRFNGGRERPKTPKNNESRVNKADPIDQWSKTPKAPSSFRQGFWTTQTPIKNTSDWDGICRHESCKLKRDDGVECNGGANVD